MAKQVPKAKNPSQAATVPPKVTKPFDSPLNKAWAPKKIWIYFFFFAISLVLYGNTLQNKYSMDDELVTLNQHNVEQGFSGIPKILTARYSVNDKQHYEYRPTTLLTFAIEYQFFGRDPAASHFFNIFFYALCGLMVYLAIRKIFVNEHWLLAFLTGFLFIIHPMHSEVAASLKNRDEMLALIFALISLMTFIKFAETIKWRYLVLGLIYFLLAAFSKKSAFPFVAIIPLVIMLTRNVKPWKVIGLTAILFVVTSVLGKLFLNNVLHKEDTLREMFFFENPMYTMVCTIGQKIMMAIATFGYYVKMMFAPYPLVSYYGYNTFDGFCFGLNHFIGIASILAVGYLFYKNFKTNKVIIIGLIFFCLGISMFCNLFVPAVGIVAERFVFESSLGFCLIVSMGILIFTKSTKLQDKIKFSEIASGIKFGFLVMTVAAAIIVIPRNNAWKNTSTLYHTDAITLPTCTKLFSLLGTIHANQLNAHIKGDTALTVDAIKLHSDTAVSYFKHALDIYPGYIAVNNNLGTIYFTYKTMLDSAGYYFNQACILDTDYVEAYFNLGNFYDQKTELAAQRLFWLNSVVDLKDTTNVDTNTYEAAKILDSYEDLFLKLMLLKTKMNEVFSKIANGQSTGDPKGAVLDAQLYYFKQMKLMKGQPLEHMALADAMIEVYKKRGKTKDQNKITYSIDSTVNHYYFEAIKIVLLKDGKIKENQLNYSLRRRIRSDFKYYRSQCIFNLRKAMRLNSEYMTAYTKLTQVLARWSLYDELITTHKAVLKNPNYKSYSINIGLADTYFAKGDFKSAANYLITSLKEMEKVTKRMNSVMKNFEGPNNSFLIMTFNKAKVNNKRHIDYYINKFMYQISNACPYETVQIQQLYNMITIL